MKQSVAAQRPSGKRRWAYGTAAVVLAGFLGALPGAAQQAMRSGYGPDWQEMMPGIREIVDTPEFREESPRPFNPVIERSTVMRNGVPVALVNLGSGYDPSKSRIIVFVAQHGRPVAATFDLGDHTIVRGGQVFAKTIAPDQREWVEIDNRNNAILTKFFLKNADGAGLATCQVDAYRWDSHRVMFRHDKRLGKALMHTACRGIAEQYIEPEQRQGRAPVVRAEARDEDGTSDGGQSWVHKILPWNWHRHHVR